MLGIHPIVLFCLLAAAPQVEPIVEAVDGFGPWRFGMRKAEVAAVEGNGPYKEVASTGGLETFHGDFAGQKTHVSFLFGSTGLNKVQVWAYPGQDLEAARAGALRVANALVDRYGGIRLDDDTVTATPTAAWIRDQLERHLAPDPAGATALETLEDKGETSVAIRKLHLHGDSAPADDSVYASIAYSPQLGIYWVFLFYQDLGNR